MNFKNKYSDAPFLPEWVEQDAILLAWPNADTDWRDILDEVCGCYKAIVNAISAYEDVVVLTQDATAIEEMFSATKHRVFVCNVAYNDTWARDFGPIALRRNDGPVLLDFTFNAWGMKFAANYDNQINRQLDKKKIFSVPLANRKDFVLEGGSIETDGKGCLLTTTNCLLAPNRNDRLDKKQIEERLKTDLGVQKVLWLNHGRLAGDDTDGHIDTLARFAPDNTIVYVACDDRADEHYDELDKMKHELATFTNVSGEPYKLIGLPLPDPIFDDDGQRLPATYANFLVCNGAVLVPTYKQPANDTLAISRIKCAYPDREIVGVDWTPLIKQHGSLHCATMQLPKGFLNYENWNYSAK